MRYDKVANKTWRKMRDLRRKQNGTYNRTSEGDSNDDKLYDKSPDTILGRRLTNLSRGGELKRSSEIEIGKSNPINNIARKRELILKKLKQKINKGLRVPGERLQREDTLYEMASLLGPDISIQDEKKIIREIKRLKLISNSKEFEEELKKILERINYIRKANKLNPIDRTELLSKTMVQDLKREKSEKKEKEKKKEKEILLKMVPVKLNDNYRILIRNNAYFFGSYHGKKLRIIISKLPSASTDKTDRFSIKSNFGKVVEINKKNIIGEIRFPGGDKYKYGIKIVVSISSFENEKKIDLKIKRL